MTRKYAVLAAVLLFAASPGYAQQALAPAPASARDSADVLSTDAMLESLFARMDARALEVQTLEADITITNAEHFSGRQSVRTGKVYVRKPDDLFLDLSKPYPRQVWISAKSVIDYRPDLKTGDRVELAPDAGRPQVLGLSTTTAELRESFEVSLAPANEKSKEFLLILVPRQNLKMDFTSAEVLIDAATLLPVVIIQRNKELDETKTYRFEKTKANPRLSDSLFEPKLPKDADIQEHEGWRGP